MVCSQKLYRKSKKIFCSVERTFVARREGSSEPPNPLGYESAFFLALSFSVRRASSISSSSVLLFCSHSVLLFFAMSQLLSDIEKLGCGCHTRAPKPISVSCVCRGEESRIFISGTETVKLD